jgi:hypothetical protein
MISCVTGENTRTQSNKSKTQLPNTARMICVAGPTLYTAAAQLRHFFGACG